jgi:hypothetical protein
MIYLVIQIILFIILGILWTIDLVETITLVHKKGLKVEANPFAKFLLKHGDINFILFKIIDFILIILIMTFIFKSYNILAQGLLIFFIIIYTITVIHNKKVMKAYHCKLKYID